MRTIAAAILVAALATPALAQTPGGVGGGGSPLGGFGRDITHPKNEEDIKKEQARENDYKAGVSKIPDQKANNDPWGNVRAADPKPHQAKASANQKKTKAE